MSRAEEDACLPSAKDDGRELMRLRALVLGHDGDRALENLIAQPETSRVAGVISEALRERARRDNSLGRVLSPLLDTAIDESIQHDPRRFTHAIYPIIGPAIRKAVAAAFADMVQTLDQVLGNSFSARAWLWRLQAWRAGKAYGEYVLLKTLLYRVEQVLLIHRDTGLLLHDVGLSSADSSDPELISAMLTAINDFVNDSFRREADVDLESIRLGEFTLQIRSGPDAALAAAIRGNPAANVGQMLNTVLEQIHLEYRHALAHFAGDKQAFESTEPLLRQCLLQQTNLPEESTPWKAWVVLTVLLMIATWLVWIDYQDELNREAIVTQLEQHPGYIVVGQESNARHLDLTLLRDINSDPPDAVLASLNTGRWDVSLKDFRIPLDEGRPPIEQPVLAEVPEPRLPTEQPESTNTEWQALYTDWRRRVAELQSTRLYFVLGNRGLTAGEARKLPSIIELVRELHRLAEVLKIGGFHILISGYADSSGREQINRGISQQRADAITRILRSNLPGQLRITARGAGELDLTGLTAREQRLVTFQVLHTKVSKMSGSIHKEGSP